MRKKRIPKGYKGIVYTPTEEEKEREEAFIKFEALLKKRLDITDPRKRLEIDRELNILRRTFKKPVIFN